MSCPRSTASTTICLRALGCRWVCRVSGARGRRIGPRSPVQPFQTAIIVAMEDLVAGLARDTEPTAQSRHLLSVQQPGNEFQPFIHLVTLLPGHFALLAKGPIV